MLYTGKGDKGETDLFACSTRISKSSAIAEALGSLDEVNSFLGFAKLGGKAAGFALSSGARFEDIVHELQQNLFIVQAEMAGTPMSVSETKVRQMEAWIGEIEKELPPIRNFFISGGTELAATFDFARTLARRAERRAVEAKEGGKNLGEHTLAFLNRLSSVLYALARLSNHKSGITEQPPTYK